MSGLGLRNHTLLEMSYHCKKCDHPGFETRDCLKNHSRSHALACKVKFAFAGPHGLCESILLHRNADMQLFRCSRCQRFESNIPKKMQMHCRSCVGVGLAGEESERTDPLIHTNSDGHGCYVEATLGFFINEDLHVAICQLCNSVVEAGSICRHAIRFHRRDVDPRRLSSDVEHFQLRSGVSSLAEYRIGSTTPKGPIAGLQAVDGFGCNSCSFYCCRVSTLERHLRSAHDSRCDAEGSHRACWVQRLSAAPRNNSWFGVHPPVISPGVPRNHLTDIIEKESSAWRDEVLQGAFEDPRHVPLFIKRLNWDHFIQNLGQDSLVHMASLVAASGSWDVWLFLSRLHKVCFSLMMEFQDIIGSADSLLRRKVKSAKDISTVPFSRLDQSCEDYMATLVHVIIVLLRSMNSNNDSNNENRDVFRILVPLDEPLRTSLENLWQGLQAEDGQGQFSDGEMRECKLRCIQVLEDLFFVERESYSIPNTSLLIYRFILFVVLQHHHVVTLDEVTGRISRMMYWCRSLVLYKIMFTLVLMADRVDIVEERFLFFVRDKHRTPFAAILEAKRLVFSITKNETPLPKVIWAGDGQIIGGLRVDITDVSSMICACIEELSKELINDVLLNMPTDGDELLKNKSGGPLEDNLQDMRCGYWFVSNRNNCCSDCTLGLVNHVVTDARLRRQFVDRVDNGDGRIV